MYYFFVSFNLTTQISGAVKIALQAIVTRDKITRNACEISHHKIRWSNLFSLRYITMQASQ